MILQEVIYLLQNGWFWEFKYVSQTTEISLKTFNSLEDHLSTG